MNQYREEDPVANESPAPPLAEEVTRLRAELARLREENTAREADPTFRELRRENADLRAECGALRDSLLASVVALAAERERVVGECCRAICGRCFAGAPIVGTANGKPLHEYSCGKEGCTRHRGATQECCAHEIRALAAPGADGREG